MSKKALLRLATSIFFAFCVTLLGHINVFANEPKPVHEYNFDNDEPYKVVDSTSFRETALDGSDYDSACVRVTGYNGIGKAKQFNSHTYSVFYPKTLPVGAQSIRFKFKKDASTVTEKSEPIFSSIPDENGSLIYIGVGRYSTTLDNDIPGHLWIIKKDTSINFELESPESICDGQWHDVLYTWDGTTNINSVKLYIDDMTAPVAQATAKSTDEGIKKTIYAGRSQYYISNYYYKYIRDYLVGTLDNIQFYDSAITPGSISPDTLSNLKATGGTSKIDLTWDAVDKATSYTVKRATTTGGPYATIATDIAETSYSDTDVTVGTTYYYIVTAIADGKESGNSNEASAIPEPSQTPPATEAKLKVVLEVSEALRLSVDDDLNINTQMSWTSSEPTVATVNEKGIVTALAPGNTVITVKSADGSYTDYINVLVVENADDYRLAIDLKVGETARLTADDFTNTANITWAPMDSSIANVTTKGKVTALSKGLVLISAKDAEGNIIGRVYVRVRE